MGFDLVSGFLGFAGLFMGLVFLVGGLLASREIDVTCVLHDDFASETSRACKNAM